MDNEQELLSQLKKGLPQAFRSLYKNQYKVVASLILKMGGDQNDVEDVFQETLYVLVKKIREPNFQLTAKISTLMHAIARNIWLKKLKKGSKEVSFENDSLISDDLAGDSQPQDHQEKELMIGVLLDNINALGEDCRNVIRMIYFKKLSHAEVAEELGYSLSFVKVKKFRCLGYLRKMVASSPFFS